MKGEKRYILFLAVTFLGIIFLSINPSFTGSSIKEGSSVNEVIIEDVLAGTSIIDSFSLAFSDDGIVKGEMYVSGDIEDWIEIEENFKALPEKEYDFPLRINVPEKTANGEYRAKIILMVVEQGGHNLFVSNPDQKTIFKKIAEFFNQFHEK